MLKKNKKGISYLKQDINGFQDPNEKEDCGSHVDLAITVIWREVIILVNDFIKVDLQECDKTYLINHENCHQLSRQQ